MFERFTDRARVVVVKAQDEARLLGHNYIGTEHLLLGMIAEGDGIAGRAMSDLGLTLESVREAVREVAGSSDIAPSGHIPFTPNAKRSLDLALRQALHLGHTYLGTEHLLLGLLKVDTPCKADDVLEALRVDVSALRLHVLGRISTTDARLRTKEVRTASQIQEDIDIAEIRLEMLRLELDGVAAKQS